MRSLAILLISLLATSASAAGVSINFDTDAAGNPLTVPAAFLETVALTNEYAPLGVTFAGPGTISGGSILNVDSNFGVPARSGMNFLAFNREATNMDGGLAIDPQTILFSTAISDFSIWAAGGTAEFGNTSELEFTAEGYRGSTLVAAQSVTASNSYEELSLSNPLGFDRVVLTESGNQTFVYDDLSFETTDQAVPEPASIVVWVLMVAMAICVRKRGREAIV